MIINNFIECTESIFFLGCRTTIKMRMTSFVYFIHICYYKIKQIKLIRIIMNDTCFELISFIFRRFRVRVDIEEKEFRTFEIMNLSTRQFVEDFLLFLSHSQ